MPQLTLTLGPVLYNWTAERWADFYFRIADEAPVDTVCIGEIVCSKRLQFFIHRFPEVIERLARGGKQILMSSLILPTLERERRMIDDLLAIPDTMVEANDISVLPRLAGRPHAIGPFVNVYNEGTLAFLARNGAVRVCLPPELALASIAALAPGAGGIIREVWAFGRVPLAISARCYHARIHGLSKDSCQFVCGEDPDGRAVETVDGQPFLAVNGVQTLSHACCNVIQDLDQIASAGVGALRLSPHSGDMVTVARLFRDVLDNRKSAEEASRQLAEAIPFAAFSNGFLHGTSGHRWLEAEAD